jgi:hypothetical protein
VGDCRTIPTLTAGISQTAPDASVIFLMNEGKEGSKLSGKFTREFVPSVNYIGILFDMETEEAQVILRHTQVNGPERGHSPRSC